MKNIPINPSNEDIFKSLDSCVQQEVRSMVERYCHGNRARFKKARQFRDGNISYINHEHTIRVNGWNVYMRHFYWSKVIKDYTPLVVRIYSTFTDSEGKLSVCVLGNTQLWSTLGYVPPCIYTTHFLSRYRLREIGDITMSISDVISAMVTDLPRNSNIIRTPLIYGCDTNKRKIVGRLEHGVRMGYFDYEKQVYVFDTYLNDAMLKDNQEYMNKDVLGDMQILGERGYGEHSVKIEDGKIRAMTKEEIYEYLERKDTQEYKDEQQLYEAEQCRRNRMRYEKKHNSAIRKKPKHFLPKSRARMYDFE